MSAVPQATPHTTQLLSVTDIALISSAGLLAQVLFLVDQAGIGAGEGLAL